MQLNLQHVDRLSAKILRFGGDETCEAFEILRLHIHSRDVPRLEIDLYFEPGEAPEVIVINKEDAAARGQSVAETAKAILIDGITRP